MQAATFQTVNIFEDLRQMTLAVVVSHSAAAFGLSRPHNEMKLKENRF